MNTWLMTAGVVIAVIATGYGLLKLKSSGEWESVDGVILESSIEKIIRSSQMRAGGDRAIDYKVNLRYRYSVNGQELTGDNVVAGVPNIAGSKIVAEDMLSQYPAGKTVPVFYNPDNPADAALITGKSIPIAGFVLFGVILVVGAGAIIFLLKSGILSD